MWYYCSQGESKFHESPKWFLCRQTENVEVHSLSCQQQLEKSSDAVLFDCDGNTAYAALKIKNAKLYKSDGDADYDTLEDEYEYI